MKHLFFPQILRSFLIGCCLALPVLSLPASAQPAVARFTANNLTNNAMSSG